MIHYLFILFTKLNWLYFAYKEKYPQELQTWNFQFYADLKFLLMVKGNE